MKKATKLFHIKLTVLFFLLTPSIYLVAQTRMHTTLSSSGVKLNSANTKLGIANKVKVTIDTNYRIFTANGIPSHSVGKFPNSGNPNRVSAQAYKFKIRLKPKFNQNITKPEMAMDFGVAINGVPFDPAAAEWYQGKRNSGWQYDALSGAVALGVDANHAHVQPTGAYHYHGLPIGLLESLNVKPGKESPQIGWAADGFPIYALYGKNAKELSSSYRLKKGNRDIGGKYDGTFVADYEFIKGSGDLDECNGIKFNGTYSYFLTHHFPVVPRCFHGTPDQSFKKKRDFHSPNPGMRKGTHHNSRRRGPPKQAVNACLNKSTGDRCHFLGGRAHNKSIRGKCFKPRGQDLSCRPSF